MEFKNPKTEFEYVENTSQKWFYLAFLSLAFSGLLALFISLARIPFLHKYFADPTFFKKGLIVHVNFGFLIWLSSFGIAIYSLLYNSSKKTLSFFISLLGTFILSISWFVIKGEIVLSNYIPMIDHPIFFIGIFLFTSGIFLALLDISAFFKSKHHFLPNTSITLLKVFAICYIIAYELGILAFLTTSNQYLSKEYYEILFWGSGHIFVFSIESLKLALWFTILNSIFKEKFQSESIIKFISVLFLILPLSSLIYIQYDTSSFEYRNFFTEIMKWGIFPYVSIVIITILLHSMKCLKEKKIEKNKKDIIQLIALFLSIFMTLYGFLLGSLIRSPNTMIPAHYHASIGSVTLTLMSFSVLLFEYYNFPVERILNSNKIFLYQPILYAIGQTIFATGFALAGFSGQGRKLYGSEQQVKGLLDYIGLSLVGIGGIIAIVAGISFIFLCTKLIIPKLNQRLMQILEAFQYFFKSSNYKEIEYGKTSHTKTHG